MGNTATVKRFLIGMIILHMHILAAPSNISKLEETTEKIEQTKLKLDDDSLRGDSTDGISSEQGQRQKRWFNYHGYGFPPISPIIYPSGSEKLEISDNSYGFEDPFVKLHKRLQELVSWSRQPILSSSSPFPFPIFFPVIYVPAPCNCVPENSPAPPNNTNDSTPDLTNRFPDTADERPSPLPELDTNQNWGFVINETEAEDADEDFSRPISFDPIIPNNTLIRPPPSVEHGSSQAGINSSNLTSQDQNNIIRSSQNQALTTQRPTSFSAKPMSTFSPIISINNVVPSVCDDAILKCCHQSQITYDCFISQGCSDSTIFVGNPCDIGTILGVIERFQIYYGQRLG